MEASCFRYLKVQVGRLGDSMLLYWGLGDWALLCWRLLCWTGLYSDELDLNKSFAEIVSKALIDPGLR